MTTEEICEVVILLIVRTVKEAGPAGMHRFYLYDSMVSRGFPEETINDFVRCLVQEGVLTKSGDIYRVS